MSVALRPDKRRVPITCGHPDRRYGGTGITPEEYAAAWERQRGKCANPGCHRSFAKDGRGTTNRLHTDHDHVTGKFRGLLCGRCNVTLGLMEESPERLRGLIAYLEAVAATEAA